MEEHKKSAFESRWPFYTGLVPAFSFILNKSLNWTQISEKGLIPIVLLVPCFNIPDYAHHTSKQNVAKTLCVYSHGYELLINPVVI